MRALTHVCLCVFVCSHACARMCVSVSVCVCVCVCVCVLCRATEVVVTPEEDLIARVTHITGGKGACGALDCMCGEMVSTLCK